MRIIAAFAILALSGLPASAGQASAQTEIPLYDVGAFCWDLFPTMMAKCAALEVRSLLLLQQIEPLPRYAPHFAPCVARLHRSGLHDYFSLMNCVTGGMPPER